MNKIYSMIGMVMMLSACGPSAVFVKDGVPGAKGDTGETGAQGIQGEQGAAGINGTNGIDGAQGIQGPAGADGTVIVPVKLCPGTPTYPSVFPEYAFCIEGELWGVYSANGGFWTKFPNGYYSSNGIGSSCTFHITGCTVSY